MKKYSTPYAEILSEGLEDVLMASVISTNESTLGFEGDETW